MLKALLSLAVFGVAGVIVAAPTQPAKAADLGPSCYGHCGCHACPPRRRVVYAPRPVYVVPPPPVIVYRPPVVVAAPFPVYGGWYRPRWRAGWYGPGWRRGWYGPRWRGGWGHAGWHGGWRRW
jgi:hypothetical protein